MGLLFIFRRAQSIFFDLNIIRTRIFLSLSAHVVDTLMLSKSSDCIDSLTCQIVSLMFPIVLLTPNLNVLVRNRTSLLILIILVICFSRKK